MKSAGTIRLLLCLIYTSSSCIFGKTLIWDLGDTLFTTSQYKIAWKIGLQHFIGYALFDWRDPRTIRSVIFNILEAMDPAQEHPTYVATDNEGNPLPVIMNRWLAGTISGKEAFISIRDYVEQLDKQKYFVSAREKNLVMKTFEQMFEPQTLVDATQPIEEALKLLHECYHAKNKDGTPKNTLIVLSNWDEVSFALLKKRYAHIFDTYFHHIVISGAIGLIKPKKDAFTYVIKTYNLNPKDCIFINDQYDNVLAAESAGILALTVCRKNYKSLRSILLRLGAL
jgi:putative hydrolase of the HAD superfamily